jgi:hypothetical protein
MPKGPKGQKRAANVIGNAAQVMRIVTGEELEHRTEHGVDAKIAQNWIIHTAASATARATLSIERAAITDASQANSRNSSRIRLRRSFALIGSSAAL